MELYLHQVWKWLITDQREVLKLAAEKEINLVCKDIAREIEPAATFEPAVFELEDTKIDKAA